MYKAVSGHSTATSEDATALLCDLTSVGGVDTTIYPAGYKGRKWSSCPSARILKQLFGRDLPNPRCSAIVMIDPDGPLVRGGPVVISLGAKGFVYGRLETKHPRKAKWMSVSIPTIDGPRLLKNWCERERVQPIIGLCCVESFD